ncbi:MAG TPA: phosphoribosylformylglycinamidine cyclo-ligase [Candidatus Omnitrophota bacterium]|nr:phosphoribosylformylglycinamidine cyclo-ligase [Candidatus Omnitrophota bacterium]
MKTISQNWTYAKAGVSVDRGNRLVKKIKSLAKRTMGRGVVGEIGTFSGCFDPSFLNLSNPLLVATTDGVGTKLEIAQELGKHDTVGIDLVAMCVNDLICTGAKPVFFLDYLACGKLDLKMSQSILKGIAKGCEEAGCALIGGETAEMPDFYREGQYDLAGFSVGLVERGKVVTGEKVREGDVILGIASSGFHSNGYSLLRKLFSKQELQGAWGKTLLRPTRIYVWPVLSVMARTEVNGVAHVTGGAFYDKIARIIPRGLCASIDYKKWPIPPMFTEVRKRGKIKMSEMFRTFNMGIGMVLVLPQHGALHAREELSQFNLKSWVIGRIEKGARSKNRVLIRNLPD